MEVYTEKSSESAYASFFDVGKFGYGAIRKEEKGKRTLDTKMIGKSIADHALTTQCEGYSCCGIICEKAASVGEEATIQILHLKANIMQRRLNVNAQWGNVPPPEKSISTQTYSCHPALNPESPHLVVVVVFLIGEKTIP